MYKIGKKVVKIIIFVGILIYYLNTKYKETGILETNTIATGIMLASQFYILTSLFGVLVNAFENYFVAFIVLFGLLFLFAVKMEEWVETISWLTAENSAIAFCSLAILFFIKDIIVIVRTIFFKRTYQYEIIEDVEHPYIPIREQIKNSPEAVLQFAYILEQQLQRKPTYQEIMDYIDSLKSEDFP